MLMLNDRGSSHDEVGDMLIKVQDDLQKLKVVMSEKDCQGIEKDLIDDALHKTESTLQKHTEELVQSLSNNVTVLPTIGKSTSQHDLKHSNSESKQKIMMGLNKPHGPIKSHKVREMCNFPEPMPLQNLGLTPGQLTREMYNLRILADPRHPHNRQKLNDHYDIQLPMINQRQPITSSKKIVYGSTIDHLSVLPKENRLDAMLEPPPIEEKDTKFGILSLLQRGLIPYNADLYLHPPPVRHKSSILHDKTRKEQSKTSVCEHGGNLSAYKLDTAALCDGTSDAESVIRMPAVTSRLTASSSGVALHSGKSRTSSKSTKSYVSQPVKTFELPSELCNDIEPPPTTPASVGHIAKDHVAKDPASHRFAIQRGTVREDTDEFKVFKEHYCLTWGPIQTAIKEMEKIMKKYDVPVAFINGDKLADLALERELNRPTSAELLGVLANKDSVNLLINSPGRLFRTKNGAQLAAAKIQATWRAYKQHKKYTEYRRKKWAAGVIAISWVMTIKLAKVRKLLKVTRHEHVISHKRRLENLAMSWDRIQKSRRVIIHIPSLGLSQHIRDNLRNINIQQNLQMARLCDIRDPNVDVIYISPVNMNDELLQYYQKLLGLLPAVESGDVDDQGNLEARYRILVPEAVNSFPTHSMALSTILKYSPKTLKRISNLIRGRNAYIITGVPHKDDLHISEILDTPVLCPDPDVSHLYSTKSGSKRIFASANVDVPPSEYDVYSLQQLHECVSQLVTDNLDIQRWLFKLDDEYDGRGIAYCDIPANMRCYNWAYKESRRYGDKWSKKWAQDAALIKIQAEVPDILAQHARPANTQAYPTWDVFLKAFLSQGGVVEACPTPDMTALTVDMFIDPTGAISMVTCGDQIHAESQFSCWAHSVPQSSIEPATLNEKCTNIAEACKTRGIVGYFSIDFVTFIDSKTGKQTVWATDLSIQYSENVSMSSFLKFITNGTLDLENHLFKVNLVKSSDQEKRSFTLANGDTVESKAQPHRYAVVSTRLHHSNLAVIHYSVFFQMCRAHGIGYDLKEKQGTVFTLIDGLSREHLGMLSVGENLQQTLAMFARNMHVIHQEISAPNMQGITNFKDAVSDIEKILGHTHENAKEIEDNVEKL